MDSSCTYWQTDKSLGFSIPETGPRGSNSSKASTSLLAGGDVEGPTAVVAWLGLVLTGGEDVLGAGAAGVAPSLISRRKLGITKHWVSKILIHVLGIKLVPLIMNRTVGISYSFFITRRSIKILFRKFSFKLPVQ